MVHQFVVSRIRADRFDKISNYTKISTVLRFDRLTGMQASITKTIGWQVSLLIVVSPF